uniref:CSON014072 protein n=1 Tax=Culicoides sonorensis TaxID=179676 RepID=A0A336MCD2_CULSO
MAANPDLADVSLYPIAVLINELKNEDIQVNIPFNDSTNNNSWQSKNETRFQPLQRFEHLAPSASTPMD